MKKIGNMITKILNQRKEDNNQNPKENLKRMVLSLAMWQLETFYFPRVNDLNLSRFFKEICPSRNSTNVMGLEQVEGLFQ